MAKSHPAQSDDQSPLHFSLWARNAVASFTLLACLISLSIILHAQYGARLTGAFVHGLDSLDFGQLVNLSEAPPIAVAADGPNDARYRAVGDNLAKRYRVSSEMTFSVVAKAHAIGEELKLDPLLILAVIAVESRFNPVAESGMGAKGLMQVIPRYHSDKFGPLGGEKAAFDPHANIFVGARILKDYLRRTGDVVDALQLYVGATSEENENGYSGKVIAERDRLHLFLRQFESQNRTARHQPALKPVAASI